ncbi:MAG: hypothetical protein HQ592_11900 [Planctomycetes bacterium]|nr:hypothetical protein [Planctomycetota bacterium]
MTLRSFFIGMILLAVSAIAITYNDYELGNTALTGGNHFPIIAVFVVILFPLLVNPGLRLLEPAWVFSQNEIIVIWCMMAAGIGIPASGLMRYLIPFMVAPFYYPLSVDDKWVTTFHHLIPDWLVPSKVLTSLEVEAFYEGLQEGQSLPWRAWVVPFFGWGIVLMATYMMMFCLTAIIRKQWVEHERLTFPLAQIPIEISQPPEKGRYFNALFNSPMMWMGAGIPILFWTLTGLNAAYPKVPFISSVSWTLTALLAKMTGWEGMWRVLFMPIGVAFLLTTEVSLSMWLFFILNNAQKITRTKFGLPGGSEFEVPQQIGAFVAFAGIALWTMRHHLRDVLRKAFLGAKDVDDSQEAMSYRTAVTGLIVAVAVIVGWLHEIGCPPYISLVFLLAVGVILLVLSRLVVQCGMLLVQANFTPLGVVRSIVGDKAIGPGGLTALCLHQAPLYGDMREVIMPTLLNNTKMGEKRLNLRMLFVAMMAAVVISYTVSYWSQVKGYYKFGANAVTPTYAIKEFPQGQCNALADAIEDPKEAFEKPGYGKHMAAGAAVMGGVYFLRSRLTWWFVHPIGVLTASTYPMKNLWLSIMIGWMCKWLVQRYARGPTMIQVKRFFIGLIIGDVMSAVFWALLGLALGKGMGVGAGVT